MKYAVLVLLLLGVNADAAVRHLAECGEFSGAPGLENPFDFDLCALKDGDDIAALLKDLGAKYGEIHVRAPSKTVSVISRGTIDWATNLTGGRVREFSFLEDQDPANKMVIQHAPEGNAYEMWSFRNVTRVVIGGGNLTLTFNGTHPGLATEDITSSYGLLGFNTDDGSAPKLVDIRANFNRTHSYGIVFSGGANGGTGESTANRIEQVNIAGAFIGSGVMTLGGVTNIWYDPQRTVVMDPYVRANGWDGVVAKIESGNPIGCRDASRAMTRQNPRVGGNYFRSVTGGVTLRYGTPSASIFVSKYVGKSVSDPFVVRVQDWGRSGPTEITGLPAGVMVKSVFSGIMKNDPMPTYGMTKPFRFVRFEQLPSQYGVSGSYSWGIESGCAPGNSFSNDYASSVPWFWSAEASRDGLSGQFVTSYMDVTFSGFKEWNAGPANSFIRAQGAGADGSNPPDRTFGHVLRAAEGTRVPHQANILDEITVTGPGSWNRIAAEPVQTQATTTEPGITLYPVKNLIINTHVHGAVVIGEGSIGTKIENVDFKGDAPREILSVASGVAVEVNRICARSGSTVGGSGTVVYKGVVWILPYTIQTDMLECDVAETSAPRPPDNVDVL